MLDGDILEINELPLFKWTRDYKTFLEEMAQQDEIEDIKEYHKDHEIKFKLQVPGIKKFYQTNGEAGIIKRFKLTTPISGNNMVLFKDFKLKRYADPNEII